MNIEKIVVARKWSVLEYDMRREGISFQEAVAKYDEKVLISHDKQRESSIKVYTGLDISSIAYYLIIGDDLPESLINRNDVELVVALGGDNYFQLVSHFIGDKPILGINSDPENSQGALTYFTPDSFINYLPRLENGDFDIEEWTRLQISLNGQRLPVPVTSEVYVGAYKSTDMSRYILELSHTLGKPRAEEQKSSGLIVATEAGETGWYNAAERYTSAREDRDTTIWMTPGAFRLLGTHRNPGHRHASFIAREPYVSNPFQGYLYHKGTIYDKEKIKITWLAHGKGLVSIDARDEYEISRGDKVEIEISDKPLRVVTP